jgi:hypothetical protein
MIKYAKVIDNELGLCEVGTGTNADFYKSIGMTQQDVEQSEKDNQWYLSEKCPHYTPEEESEQREEQFYNTFLATSKGNYRLKPRGYSNAQQSIDTVNGMVNALGALTEQIAEMVIFYPTPDFTKEEECTEEWLVSHQYNIEPLTKEQWVQFYIEFSTLYAQDQYKKAAAEKEQVEE